MLTDYDGEQLLIATRIAGQRRGTGWRQLRAQLLRFPLHDLRRGGAAFTGRRSLWLKRVPWFHKPEYAGPLRTGNLITDSKEGRA